MSVAAGNWRVFGWIILAVTVWCLVHTIGSYRLDPRRAWVLAACAGGFLGFWALVLLVRHRGQRANVDGVCWSVPCLGSFILAVSALILFAGLSFGWFGSEARRMLAVGSVSNTAEFGDYTRGSRIINESTRAEMKRILDEVQSGQFAKEWILENRAGAASFKAVRRRNREHNIEEVGRRLRKLMTWIDSKEV